MDIRSLQKPVERAIPQ